MESVANLSDLIREPRETLDVEVKEWLNLTDKDHRAKLAKAIIALANNGGGYFIAGFEELSDGTFSSSNDRPAHLREWSQDAIQDIVAKYVDPPFQCRVTHQSGTEGGEKHPIIIVPGGHRVPVRARAGSPDGKTLVPHKVYIRRPGPASEEPQSAAEWDCVFERCLQNRKAELLDAFRAIMAGEIPTAITQTPTRFDDLAAFEQKAISHWEDRVAGLPSNASPRLYHGYQDFAFAIDGPFDRKSLLELRDIIDQAVRSHSGWPPFVTLHRQPFAPKPLDGAVECWMGPDTDGSYDKPAHHDFWRVSPAGLLFTRRGYYEDGSFRDLEPGKFIDICTLAEGLGEAVLEASYIARALNASGANIICRCRWTGLAGRRLVSVRNPNRLMINTYSSAQDVYEASETVPLSALPDALPEVVFAFLAPLYELFDFFRLPKRTIEELLTSLQRNRY